MSNDAASPPPLDENQIIAERRAKLAALRAQGPAYPNDFRRDAVAGELHAQHDAKQNEELDASPVTVAVAGRMVLKRVMGKACFATLQDMAGRIQLYVTMDNVGVEALDAFKHWDLGDIIGAMGALFRTKTGELSVKCDSIRLLAKALRPLPEKFHGLVDTEQKYRQRYLDLITNPVSRDIFVKRSRIVQTMREFFAARGYLEVETPMMQSIPGGAAARPFRTHHNALDMDLYLRIAPELYLKRLLVGGLEKVYEINRNFRNEGISTRHNPEFTMLEVYQSYGNFEDMMRITEELISSLVYKMYGTYKINYQGQEIDFTTPWERRSFAKVVKEHFDINPEDTAEVMLAKVKDKRSGSIKIDRLTRSAIMKIVEDVLDEKATANPVFMLDYFTFLSPLAKAKVDNPAVAQRFEFFIAGMEV